MVESSIHKDFKADKSRAASFVKLELKLNELQFLGCPVGGLLSKFHGIHKADKSKPFKVSWLRTLAIMLNFALKGFFKKDFEIKGNKAAQILLSKLVDRHHCNALIDPIKRAFADESLLYTPGNGNEVSPYSFTRKVTLLRLWKALLFLRRNWKKINPVYDHHYVQVNKSELFNVLLIQLIALQAWLDFFKDTNIKLVVVDFDRDTHNAPLILAAQRSGIKTVSLVHGVITTEYGYSPVVADELWCWSEFQKSQLHPEVVDIDKVKVVGSPIAQRFNVNRRLNGRPGKLRIGVGLNPIGREQNYSFLNHLFEENLSNRVSWDVKLHPSMSREDWMKKIEGESIRFFENDEIDLEEYFDQVDLLVVGNSGIGFEAILNSVPVWVYRISEHRFGNDSVMIEQAGCPDISERGSYCHELHNLLNEADYLKELLIKEQGFVLNDFYAQTGTKATAEIIHNMNIKLKDAI